MIPELESEKLSFSSRFIQRADIRQLLGKTT